ncbi:N-acetylglucosamine-6-phosphate deacetylase [Microvirga sp. SRT01]|uniref:N-acetylglucosamine-6-phosphate deacetylase n=1 Tax=Sphingomonas longa TaxID=2778730 RepID=A0ABS2DAD2_9SPHN|nr:MULTISPECIES: N-acetylglucosamine-6-phosphate deacetylase [Alphaproteobacteria]MBM6577897.1 N-acetylglucosamine-6-phosphate deacetylase [Sphingomonas sp. BT552]MBR7710938.1 N-acetylglucosamine-6-phosphate deacetylase [Microvirga sp. SRT01]
MTTMRFGNGHVVAGDAVWPGATIAVDGERIAEIDAFRGAGDIDLAGGWLMPGFVDTQVNGGGGVLFNNDISVGAVAAIARAHAAFGTTALLPTLISETPDRIAAALEATDAAIAQGVPGVVGVHIEGPFLNVARKGIHDPERFRRLDAETVALLSRPHRGTVMLTIAPELTDTATISQLVAAGVIVSAGHSEASFEQAKAAFDAGLSGITHLFNAMPPMMQREPGLVGAALDDARPWCGLIVDRVHVAAAVLRVAMRARPHDRMMLVTDAMSSVGAVDKDFVLQGRPIRVADGICRFADGTLAGSDLDMAQAVANAVADLDVPVTTVAAMAATIPATFLGLQNERGTLAKGLRADWVQLDAQFRPVATWIGGRAVA